MVLVVDDDLTMLKLMKMTLENAGFGVCLAPRRTEALELMQRGALEIGVAIVDYQMPGSRLSDLLSDIRSHPGKIRPIVTSGYSLDILRQFGVALPAGVDFLKKPFMPRDLVAAVRRAFTKAAASGS